MKAYDLRPLGIGEILDRAVSLFVSRFASLILILSLITVPVAIVRYLAQPDTATLLGDMQRLLSLGPGDTAQRGDILRAIGQHSALSGWVFAAIGFGLILGPLGSTACIVALSDAYRGREISVRAAYARAVRCWPAQLGVGLLFIGVFAVAVVATSLMLVVAAIAIGAVGALSRVAGLVVGIPVGVGVLLVFIAIYALVYLAYELAFIAIAIEDPHPVRALGRALQQTFARATFWRSLAVAMILAVVQTIGIYLAIALAGGLALVTHLSALYPVIVTICSVMLSAFVSAFFLVYAIDVRVRREGYDLALAAQSLS